MWLIFRQFKFFDFSFFKARFKIASIKIHDIEVNRMTNKRDQKANIHAFILSRSCVFSVIMRFYFVMEIHCRSQSTGACIFCHSNLRECIEIDSGNQAKFRQNSHFQSLKTHFICQHSEFLDSPSFTLMHFHSRINAIEHKISSHDAIS